MITTMQIMIKTHSKQQLKPAAKSNCLRGVAVFALGLGTSRLLQHATITFGVYRLKIRKK
jgi:hypothetical protein